MKLLDIGLWFVEGVPGNPKSRGIPGNPKSRELERMDFLSVKQTLGRNCEMCGKEQTVEQWSSNA